MEQIILREITLREKLTARGLDKCTLCWVKNWLHGRVQSVMANGVKSTWRSVTNVVHQRLVLGLFNIFIDDQDKGLEDTLSKNADDNEHGGNVDLPESRKVHQRDVEGFDC